MKLIDIHREVYNVEPAQEKESLLLLKGFHAHRRIGVSDVACIDPSGLYHYVSYRRFYVSAEKNVNTLRHLSRVIWMTLQPEYYECSLLYKSKVTIRHIDFLSNIYVGTIEELEGTNAHPTEVVFMAKNFMMAAVWLQNGRKVPLRRTTSYWLRLWNGTFIK